MFKLNDDKTGFIVFKSQHNVNTFVEQNVQVGGTKVGIILKIKYLGVTFDQMLSMQARVNTIAKKMLTVHTFVISRWDYCKFVTFFCVWVA